MYIFNIYVHIKDRLVVTVQYIMKQVSKQYEQSKTRTHKFRCCCFHI